MSHTALTCLLKILPAMGAHTANGMDKHRNIRALSSCDNLNYKEQ